MSEGAALVSIVIPTYNRPRHVLLTVKSVLAQTYADLEVIVQDNASELDLTAAIAQLGDPRVRYFRNERNVGPTRNFALGLSRATGEFVGLVADDDLIDSRFVEKLVSPLVTHPDAIASFCNFWVVDDTDSVNAARTDQLNRYFGMHVVPSGYHADCEVFALQYRAIGIISGAILRRSATDWAAIPVNLSIRVGDLYLMYLAACTRKGCCYIPERLTYISHSAGTLTTSFGASLDAKIINTREHLLCWTMAHRDRRLANRRYYHLKRAHCAARLVFYLFRTKRWKEALVEALDGIRTGLFLPRSAVEHFACLMDIRHAGLQRRVP